MAAPIIVGISGATGAIYGVETLRILKELGLSAHLIITEMGQRTLAIETDSTIKEIRPLA